MQTRLYCTELPERDEVGVSLEAKMGYMLFELLFFPDRSVLAVTAKRTKPWMDTVQCVKVSAPRPPHTARQS